MLGPHLIAHHSTNHNQPQHNNHNQPQPTTTKNSKLTWKQGTNIPIIEFNQQLSTCGVVEETEKGIYFTLGGEEEGEERREILWRQVKGPEVDCQESRSYF